MHRNYSILSVLAAGLVLLATAGMAAEYNGVTAPGLAPVDASQRSLNGKVRIVEATTAQSKDDSAEAEARKRLKIELDRVRREAQEKNKADSKSGASKSEKQSGPAKAEKQSSGSKQEKKGKEAASGKTDASPQPAIQAVPALDPEINRAAGKLIIMSFSGSQSSDNGPKAIRALIHDGLIAGVIFRGENIQSKTQLKDLIKFFSPSGKELKPVFAISEFGGESGGFPRIKDFEPWPSQREVASRGDPEYAYLTYRSLGSFLSGLGFNMNFGPTIGAAGAARDPSASFSESPLQAGVFAKTFILGHRDDNIITVPVVDSSDLAVRAMKTLLVSYPVMPIAVGLTEGADPFVPYDGLVRGPRFCFVTLNQGSDAAGAAIHFNRGCDVLVVDGGKDNPAAVRDIVARGVGDAIKSGSLTMPVLDASAQKLSNLRFPPPPQDGFTTRTSQ